MRSRLMVRGRTRVPGDKSISHRALMFGALARGRSRVSGLLQSDDVKSTARVLRSLGWDIPDLSESITIKGGGRRSHLSAPHSDLDCGNSGTTTRLVAGIAAAQSFASTFVGDASLSKRPMRRVAAPLTAMGARIDFLEGHDGLPMTVHGRHLSEIDCILPVASAQLKSAVLLAALCGDVPVRVREPARTRDHTERMLKALGADIVESDGWVILRGSGDLAPLELEVPGDPSSAAFFAVLAALADEGTLTIERVLLNPHRVGFIGVLRRMGVRIDVVERETDGGEPLGDLTIHAGVGGGTEISPEEIPSLVDEVPILAVLASRAQGETVVRGASELRVKESDRIAAVVSNLRAVGVEADEHPDGLVVRGTRASLGGNIVTHGDHRIAMAFAVLGATRDCEIRLDDPACVSVSFPTFWGDLADVSR